MIRGRRTTDRVPSNLLLRTILRWGIHIMMFWMRITKVWTTQFCLNFRTTLILDRHPGPPLTLPPRRSITVLYSSSTTPPDSSNDPKYPHCGAARLVPTLVLAERIKGLDQTSTNVAGLIRWRLQGEDGGSHDQLAG